MWYLLHPATPGSVTPPPRIYLGGPTAAPITIGRKAATVRPDGPSVSRRHATVTVAPVASGSADDSRRGDAGGGPFPARPTAVFLHDTSAHGTWVVSAAAAAATASTSPVAAARKAPAGIASLLLEGDRLSFGAASAGAYSLCWDPFVVAVGVEDSLLSSTIHAHAAAAGFATLPATAALAGAPAIAASSSVKAPTPPAPRFEAFPATAVWGAPGRPVTRLLRAAAAGATPVTPAWTGALVDAVKSSAGVLPAPHPYAPAVVGLPGVARGGGGVPAGNRSVLDSSNSEAAGRGNGGGGGGDGGGGGGGGVGGDGDGFPPPLAGLLLDVRVLFARGDTRADWTPVVLAAGGAVATASGAGSGSGAGRLLHVTGPPEGLSAAASATTAAKPPQMVSGDEGVGGRVGVVDLAAALLRGDTAPLFGVSLAAAPEGGESPSPAATVGRAAKRARVGGAGGSAGGPAAAVPPRVVANARARAMAMLGFDSSSDEEGEERGGQGGSGITPAVPVASPLASDAAAAAAATGAVSPGAACRDAAMGLDGAARGGGGVGSPGPAGGTAGGGGGGEATATDVLLSVALGDGADTGNEVSADGRADADAWAVADDGGGGSNGSLADASLPPESPVAPGFVPAPAATRRRFHGRHRRGDGTTASAGDDDRGVNPVVVAPLHIAGGVPGALPPRLLRSQPQGPLRGGQPSGGDRRGGVDVRVFAVRQRAAPRLIPLVAVRGGAADGGAGGV